MARYAAILDFVVYVLGQTIVTTTQVFFGHPIFHVEY